MVAVLVLGPKPQPLLVLLLWFFGSVLPRATWDREETGEETLAHVSSAAANICLGSPTLKRARKASSVLFEEINLAELNGPTSGKRGQCVITY